MSEKANGGNGPGVADILNAKSAADLEIGAMGLPGTQGQSGDGLKRATADFLESDTGLKASVEGLIISITEPYFKAFAEAAKSGSALMSGIDMDEVEVFRQCCVTHVQRSGTRDVRLFVAKEVRDLWPEMCMRWCNLHRDWDTVHALCDAAVRLYGGITVHDLAAIVDRFDENGGKTSEELLESALGVRASCWDSMHFVEDGTIYGDKFESLDSYREFARKRDVYPRWETDDYGEFYEYSDRKYFENTQQREAIVEFLMKTFGDSRKTAEGVANEMQSDLRDGASAGTIADMFAVDFLSPDMSRRKVAEIASLVRDVRDNMRLAEYNGNTYSELSQKGTVASTAPKVGRNDPCPCGSGLKYKKCCGRNGNYASIRTCDIANGEGVRVSLFVSGCTHHCKGCFNEAAWDFAYGEPFTKKTENEILAALEPDFIDGLTLLGGEPMEPENQRALMPLLRRFREKFGDAKTLWIYTGCVLETDLKAESRWRTEVTDEMLSLTDVLVDGPFLEAKKDISLQFRGSSNQRIIRLR